MPCSTGRLDAVKGLLPNISAGEVIACCRKSDPINVDRIYACGKIIPCGTSCIARSQPLE
jgi:hypothetical protein